MRRRRCSCLLLLLSLLSFCYYLFPLFQFSSTYKLVNICNKNNECVEFQKGIFGSNVLQSKKLLKDVSRVIVPEGSQLAVFFYVAPMLPSLSFLDGIHECKTDICEKVTKIEVTDSFTILPSNHVVQICSHSNGYCKYFSEGTYKQQLHSFFEDSRLVKLSIPNDMIIFLFSTESDIPYQSLSPVTMMHDLELLSKYQLSENDDLLTKEMIETFPSVKTFHKDDVSLVTQFSVNRFERFNSIIKNWKGPISVVIYFVNPWDIFTYWTYILETDPKFLENVTFTIYKPNYGTDFRLYPINKLRNIGILQSLTDYIFVIDADFVPDPVLYQNAKKFAIPKLKSNPRQAFVVGSLAVQENFNGKLPENIMELKKLFRNGTAYITSEKGHGPTKYQVLFNNQFLKNCDEQLCYYEVCFLSQWEPYYILTKNSPLYDERFYNQGGDKQQHSLVLNAEGYRFFVIRNHFIYHLDHFSSFKWPGGEFRSGAKKTFHFFSDFLPELNQNYSIFNRLPKCKNAWDTLSQGD